MPYRGTGAAFGLAVSVALHALLFAVAAGHLSMRKPHRPADEPTVIQLSLLPPPEAVVREAPTPAPAPVPPALPVPTIAAPKVVPVPPPETPRQPATMAAPPAPTAEEWAFASRYTLKNSKAYRYTWGQQVRSMMGTAVEGPDQGMVRFRVEIAPDGSLASLDTVWSTSPVAERLARQAIANMPRWPATPTGRPLVFEKTISFTPFASDGPPLYKDDCLPDPPVFSNPFAWDGQSVREPVGAKPTEKPDPQSLEDCLRQLPQDSIEAETARDQRMMKQWGWGASRLRR
ncbi:MAG: energy transducer TonB [Burkholderiales bacterium]|nr:energy transducer TonB [Burkholderiales bacterium]